MCQAPAMKNGRCRLHGGKSPGAPRGKANGNYVSGRYTKEAIEHRRQISALLQVCRKHLSEMADGAIGVSGT